MSSLFLLQFITGYGKEQNEETDCKEGEGEMEVVYDTEEFVENRIFLGDGEDEIIFVLDYMCPYCKKWYEEVFPKVKEEYIDTGKVKFYFQPQVYLSKKTLALTEFTQKVEKLYPDEYFALVNRIIRERDLEDWETEKYIRELSEEMELTGLEDVDLGYDVIRKTRQVTRGLNVDVVPTIIVNGRHVSDSHNFEEIKTLIEETTKAKWKATGDLCDESGEDC